MMNKVSIFDASYKCQVKWSSEHLLKICNLWYISYPQPNLLFLCLPIPHITVLLLKSPTADTHYGSKIKYTKWQFKHWVPHSHMPNISKPELRVSLQLLLSLHFGHLECILPSMIILWGIVGLNSSEKDAKTNFAKALGNDLFSQVCSYFSLFSLLEVFLCKSKLNLISRIFCNLCIIYLLFLN